MVFAKPMASRIGRAGRSILTIVERPSIDVSTVVLGAPDARELAKFYSQLLGWTIAVDEGDWVMLRHPTGGTGLSFQSEPDHVAPTWPQVAGDQQMMVHLDLGVDDMDRAVEWAIDAGATLADRQPQAGVRVMLDPAGHPFCLFPIDA